MSPLAFLLLYSLPAGHPNPNLNLNLNPSKGHSNNEHFLLGRGMIVADFVTQADEEHSIQNYNQTLLKDCTKYSAFNFVSIEIGWVCKDF